MNSIIQGGKCCWLCGANGSCDPLDKHHVFGGARRDASERYGLTVWLCHDKCHIFGQRAVHRCGETRERLQAEAQETAMRHYGWTKEEFIAKFGKNYLDGEPEEKESGCFAVLGDELCVNW